MGSCSGGGFRNFGMRLDRGSVLEMATRTCPTFVRNAARLEFTAQVLGNKLLFSVHGNFWKSEKYARRAQVCILVSVLFCGFSWSPSLS